MACGRQFSGVSDLYIPNWGRRWPLAYAAPANVSVGILDFSLPDKYWMVDFSFDKLSGCICVLLGWQGFFESSSNCHIEVIDMV